MTSLLSWEGIQGYIFSTTAVFSTQIRQGLGESTINLGQNIIEVVQSLFTLIAFLSLICIKLSVIAFPYLSTVIDSVVDFHRTQLTWKEIMGEVAFITLFTLYVLFRERILTSWKRLEKYVSTKSKAFAKVLPHCLFLGSTVSVCILFKKILTHLAAPTYMPIFTLLIPLLNTIRIRYFTEQRYSSYRQLISLWIVLGLYHFIATACSFVPFSKHALLYTLYLRQFVLISTVWIQLSSSLTDVAMDLVLPVKRFVTTLPTFHVSITQSNAVLRAANYVGLLNTSQTSFLINLFQDGMVLIFAILFVFTPFPAVGFVIVALLFPIFNSARAVDEVALDDLGEGHPDYAALVAASEVKDGESKSARKGSGGFSHVTPLKTPKAKTQATPRTAQPFTPFSPLMQLAVWMRGGDDAQDQADRELLSRQKEAQTRLALIRGERQRWVEYWICFAGLMLLHLCVIRIWQSILIVLTLWLQHSYFCGASELLLYIISVATFMRSRNERLREELDRREAEARSESGLADESEERLDQTPVPESSVREKPEKSPRTARARKSTSAPISAHKRLESPTASAGSDDEEDEGIVLVRSPGAAAVKDGPTTRRRTLRKKAE